MGDAKIQSAVTTVVPSVSWWQSPQVLAYGAGIVSGVLTVLRAFGISVFKTPTLETLFAGGIVGTASCIYALYRRWKTGKDPANPTPQLTK